MKVFLGLIIGLELFKLVDPMRVFGEFGLASSGTLLRDTPDAIDLSSSEIDKAVGRFFLPKETVVVIPSSSGA